MTPAEIKFFVHKIISHNFAPVPGSLRCLECWNHRASVGLPFRCKLSKSLEFLSRNWHIPRDPPSSLRPYRSRDNKGFLLPLASVRTRDRSTFSVRNYNEKHEAAGKGSKHSVRSNLYLPFCISQADRVRVVFHFAAIWLAACSVPTPFSSVIT